MLLLFKLIRESGATIGSLVVIALLACISSLLAVLPPHFLGAATNVIVGTEFSTYSMAYSPIKILNEYLAWAIFIFEIKPIVLFLILFFLANLLYQIVRNIFAVYVSLFSNNFIIFIRKKCYSKIIKGEKREIEKFKNGDIVHRIMNDTLQLDYLIGNPLYTICSDVLDLLWISVIIILIDWKILPILSFIIPFIYFISNNTAKIQRKFAKSIQQNEASCTGFIQSSVMGIDTVKACQAEQREIDEFSRLNDENNAVRRKSSISLGFFFPQEGLLRALGTIAVLAYVVFLATKDVTYIGTIPVLLIYTTKFYAPIGNWARYYQTIQRGLVSYQRLKEIMAISEEQTETAPKAKIERLLPFKIDGAISLESGKTVPFSVDVVEPSLIVLKGKSGIGKTRLIKSLVGLGCQFNGVLTLGGKNFKGNRLRSHVALATQDGHFIPGTLAQNLAYPSITIDNKKCQEILTALGLGYSIDHPVAEFGQNLSVGEQRRVIFGRALYSDKPIMLLDEIDANVDKETRDQIYATIEKKKSQKVILMVSHIYSPELNGYKCISSTIVQE